MSEHALLVDTRAAYTAGGVAAFLISAAIWAAGPLSGVEARVLLQGTLPSVRFLSSTTAAASTTILALMLTALGLNSSHEGRFSEVHYRRIKQISRFATWTLASSVLLLMMIVIPLDEAENLDVGWYSYLYYFILGSSAVLAG
jgi:hypothetical protein